MRKRKAVKKSKDSWKERKKNKLKKRVLFYYFSFCELSFTRLKAIISYISFKFFEAHLHSIIISLSFGGKAKK
jgi:hypothetical protein